jgi:hypothetical protein
VVVHCRRTPSGVEVDEVLAVEDLQSGATSTSFTVTDLFNRQGCGAPLRWTGNLPVRAGAALEAAGYDLLRLFDPDGSAVDEELDRRSGLRSREQHP